MPTLFVHRTDDVVPIGTSRHMAGLVPGSQLIELPGNDHIPWFGDADSVLDVIEDFATGHRVSREPERALRTVLFTDIVSSTKTAADLGDTHWRQLLDRHDEYVESVIESHDGRAVKSLGDGHLAVFNGPAAAVRCARELCENAPEIGVELRAGVHSGECEIRGDDLGGIAVHIGARIGSLAGPGEVLVSSTVRELVVGSNLVFGERGEHELKGVPGQWRVYALDGVGEALPVPDHTRVLRIQDRVGLQMARRAPRFTRAANGLVFRRAVARQG